MSFHYSASPAVTLVIKLTQLETAILEYGNEMSSEDARSLHNTLTSDYKNFVDFDLKNWYYFDLEKWCVQSDFVIKQVFRLEKKLLQFFSPVYTLSPMVSDSNVNDQVANTANLSPLLQKQEFYIEMIESLEPTGDLKPLEAKVQSNHLDKFHEKFISNQSEIATLVKDTSYQHQVEISETVQRKVRQIQTKLEEIILPIKLNENFNQTERLHVIVNSLDSQLKKQTSLIKQIELIESKNDLSAIEAETLHSHLSQLHDAFVENQSKMEIYINGPAFDEQLKISEEILQKVIAVQIKLKGIFVPVTPVPEGKAQAKSRSVTSIPEGVSFAGVEALSKSLGSQSYLNKNLGTLTFMENEVYENILQSIVHAPEVAGSIHIRPLVDNSYASFLTTRKYTENDVREFPHLFKKVEEVSARVERAVNDYKLYCKGQISKKNFNYVFSLVNASRKRNNY